MLRDSLALGEAEPLTTKPLSRPAQQHQWMQGVEHRAQAAMSMHTKNTHLGLVQRLAQLHIVVAVGPMERAGPLHLPPALQVPQVRRSCAQRVNSAFRHGVLIWRSICEAAKQGRGVLYAARGATRDSRRTNAGRSSRIMSACGGRLMGRELRLRDFLTAEEPEPPPSPSRLTGRAEPLSLPAQQRQCCGGRSAQHGRRQATEAAGLRTELVHTEGTHLVRILHLSKLHKRAALGPLPRQVALQVQQASCSCVQGRQKRNWAWDAELKLRM